MALYRRDKRKEKGLTQRDDDFPRELLFKIEEAKIGFGYPPTMGATWKLEPGEGEPTQAVQRRLTAAADVLGMSLEVRRTARAVYLWTSSGPASQSPEDNLLPRPTLST